MGGGGGGSDSGGYDAAPMQYQAKKNRQRKEEKTLGGSSGGNYVTSGGNIVRSSSGSGVLTSQGVQQRQAFQESEYQSQSSGSAVAQDTIRQGAIYDLQKRMQNVVPGTLGAMSRLNLQKQIDALKAGGTPTKALSSSGRYVTVGVQTKDGQMLGRKSAGGDTAMLFDTQGGDGSGAVTSEVTSEIVPDDAGNVGLTGGRSTRGSKRTRGKRSGGAGADYGTGILSGN